MSYENKTSASERLQQAYEDLVKEKLAETKERLANGKIQSFEVKAGYFADVLRQKTQAA